MIETARQSVSSRHRSDWISLNIKQLRLLDVSNTMHAQEWLHGVSVNIMYQRRTIRHLVDRRGNKLEGKELILALISSF